MACVQEKNRLLAQAEYKEEWSGWNKEEKSANKDLGYELALKPEEPKNPMENTEVGKVVTGSNPDQSVEQSTEPTDDVTQAA